MIAEERVCVQYIVSMLWIGSGYDMGGALLLVEVAAEQGARLLEPV